MWISGLNLKSAQEDSAWKVSNEVIRADLLFNDKGILDVLDRD